MLKDSSKFLYNTFSSFVHCFIFLGVGLTISLGVLSRGAGSIVTSALLIDGFFTFGLITFFLDSISTLSTFTMLSLIFLSFTCLIVPVLGSILVDVIFFSSIFGLVTFLEDVFLNLFFSHFLLFFYFVMSLF